MRFCHRQSLAILPAAVMLVAACSADTVARRGSGRESYAYTGGRISRIDIEQPHAGFT